MIGATAIDDINQAEWMLGAKPAVVRPSESGLGTSTSCDNGMGLLGSMGLYVYAKSLSQTTPIMVIVKTMDEEITPDLSVAEIKNSFGLNRSQLAEVLHCSRPQLNKWLSGDEPQKEDIRQRIAQVSQWLSSIPAEHAQFYGRLSKRYISASDTLVDKMKDPAMDSEEFYRVYQALKPVIEELSNKIAAPVAGGERV